ncbi:ABC transporter permease [Nocardia huaxiensis]|uniref:ABC transporter permease n=1 Tax=Nocardia huaxiensis TaxID=2755382 RepID=A0A7D6Z6I0_9NOCA|nr:ABC transporter permease [Nocardia huaxiensis]QLY32824.1 ABC transporter permease [Nocardia huaxiensis]UFS93430.1 ABC transporter permease [Nocardia huaxiensis]
MNLFAQAWEYLTTAANWSGPTGIGSRIAEHLWYSFLAVAGSAIVAVPLGMLIGHTRRGSAAIVGFANAMRALPTLGLLTFFVLLMGLGLIPPLLALLTVGIPPLLAGAYAGVANVDATVVDASRAMGMKERQILLGVELPNALPVLLTGLRAATLQVVATATIAAYVNLGGLGRYIFDGIGLYKYDRVLVGAILVAALALALDALLALVVRRSAPGVRQPLRKSSH